MANLIVRHEAAADARGDQLLEPRLEAGVKVYTKREVDVYGAGAAVQD